MGLAGCNQVGQQPIPPINNNNFTQPNVNQGGTVTPKGTRALVYSGPGACPENCAQAASDMAVRSGLTPVFVGPSDLDPNSTDAEKQALFKDVAVWIQPGGTSSTVLTSMTSTMIDALKNFVSTGGGYVGFCAGAFSATQKDGDSSIDGFNIFPGLSALYQDSNNADIVNVQWEGKSRYVYWEGGPYLSELPAGLAEPIAYYPNGQIAAARSSYGSGKVFIAGFHPEAPQQWRTYYGMNDPDGLDYDLVDEMIQWVR